MRAFIGASDKDGILSIYKELASNVATILARKGFKLVYGGGSTGIAGTIYMTYKYENGKVKGFYDVSEATKAEELELDAIDVAKNTFHRTNNLYMHADLIVILPGGFQALSELFAMLVEKQTKIEDKRIVLFNYNKFYDNILYQLKDMIDERFIDEDNLRQFDIVTNISDFENYINNLEMKEVE